jgi:hypothetical protein
VSSDGGHKYGSVDLDDDTHAPFSADSSVRIGSHSAVNEVWEGHADAQSDLMVTDHDEGALKGEWRSGRLGAIDINGEDAVSEITLT